MALLSLRRTLSHPAPLLATGFGSGLSPRAPGTVGTAVALLPWWFLQALPWWQYALALAVAFAIGVWAADWVIRETGVQDPGLVVWDEFVGVWITLAATAADPAWMLVGFAVFRVFDIWKPWPIGAIDERVGGGFGAMLDDALAGVFGLLAMLALQAGWRALG